MFSGVKSYSSVSSLLVLIATAVAGRALGKHVSSVLEQGESEGGLAPSHEKISRGEGKSSLEDSGVEYHFLPVRDALRAEQM